jgi:hypothetical protein
MLGQFTVYDAQADTYESKGKTVTQTKYLLQDAAEGAKLGQYVEFSQPDNAPQMTVGSRVEIEITEIPMIFSGRPRIRGKIRSAVSSKTPPPSK